MVQIDSKKLLLTKPIVDAIKKINPEISLKGMKRSNSSPGFGLSRLEENLQKHLDTMPPITVKAVQNNGEVYYDIQDGRHRAAITLAKGHSTIDAEILNGGRKKTRKVKKACKTSRRKY